MAQSVIIENPKTGEQYAVTPAAYRAHYEEAGFKILHWEGGAEYEKGKRNPGDPGGADLNEPVGPQPEAQPEG